MGRRWPQNGTLSGWRNSTWVLYIKGKRSQVPRAVSLKVCELCGILLEQVVHPSHLELQTQS